MGLLVDGNWQDRWYDTKASGGRFVRKESSFRGQVRADGSSDFPAEAGRYHLYVSMACPWAHRTLIFRKLKGLERVISVSGVDALMLDEGWTFSASNFDPIAGRSRMHEVYTAADPHYSGRVTVPVLWDRQQQTIVSNESSELIRMFNSAFAAVAQGDDGHDYYPAALRAEIDAVNAASTTTSTTASTSAALPPPRRPMTRPWASSSTPCSGSKSGLRAAAGSWARWPRRPTGGSFRPCCALTRSTTVTSSAACLG